MDNSTTFLPKKIVKVIEFMIKSYDIGCLITSVNENISYIHLHQKCRGSRRYCRNADILRYTARRCSGIDWVRKSYFCLIADWIESMGWMHGHGHGTREQSNFSAVTATSHIQRQFFIAQCDWSRSPWPWPWHEALRATKRIFMAIRQKLMFLKRFLELPGEKHLKNLVKWYTVPFHCSTFKIMLDQAAWDTCWPTKNIEET
uniref:Uncharacterized protein n=1 Tax=Romanomermis culicivorax TaxID=13658 RepID=A0A915IVH4_ROMCU